MGFAFSFFSCVTLFYNMFTLFKVKERGYYLLILLLIIISFFFFALRTIDSGTDTKAYVGLIHNPVGIEFLSSQFFSFLSWSSDDYSVWLATIFFFQYIAIIISARFLFNLQGVVLCLIYIAFSYVYFDLFTNILRQGLSLSLVLIAFSIFFKNRILAIFLLCSAPLLHASALLYILVLPLYYILYRVDLRCLISLAIFSLSVFIFFVFNGGNLALIAIKGLDFFVSFLSKDFVSVKMLYSLTSYSENIKGSILEFNSTGKIRLFVSLLMPLILAFFYKGKSNLFRLLISSYIGLCFIYLVMAFQGYSYRYLYLAQALNPFIFVYVVQDLSTRFRYSELALISLWNIYSIYYFWPAVLLYNYSWLFL